MVKVEANLISKPWCPQVLDDTWKASSVLSQVSFTGVAGFKQADVPEARSILQPYSKTLLL